ncbi:LysM peptidoglycan-binding domain-containing protein [Amedibacillus sp. YH-ame10]
MKTMKIEKKLLFAEKIQEVNQLEVKSALMYQKEEDGSVRATGPLFVRGSMRLDDGDVQTFQEVLDMDVLAPAHKLSSEPFALHVKDYYADVVEDGITLAVNMNILGLKEEASEDYKEVSKSVPLPVIEPVIEEQDEEMVTQPEEVGMVVDEFEDLFEESDTTYTSYRMVVAKPEDSYASIAKRYDVSEEDLRSANRNKDVVGKSLVVLPF